jgi:hypothetical protein
LLVDGLTEATDCHPSGILRCSTTRATAPAGRTDPDTVARFPETTVDVDQEAVSRAAPGPEDDVACACPVTVTVTASGPTTNNRATARRVRIGIKKVWQETSADRAEPRK